MNTESLADHLMAAGGGASRCLVAIAGPPGAGKSTLADQLDQVLKNRGESSCVVPMDGFHLDNGLLEPVGLLARKGSVDTFDAAGFVHLINRLEQANDDVVIPTFDRVLDKSIAGAMRVAASIRWLLVEGNYLLVDVEPWCELQGLWQHKVFINPGMDILRGRLIQRWLDHGHTEKEAEQRAMGNDIPNAEWVLARTVVDGCVLIDN